MTIKKQTVLQGGKVLNNNLEVKQVQIQLFSIAYNVIRVKV